MNRKRISWMGIWYLAIAVAFLLLAIDHLILHDKAWLIAIRFIVAAGFGFLAFLEFTKKKKL